MKNRYILTVFVTFLFFVNSNFGQGINKNNFKNTIYIGYPVTIFDPPDIGIYLAYNPTLMLNKYFALEFQISYAYGSYERESGWFVHNGGSINYVNYLWGIRLYLFNQKMKINPYINILAGGSYYVDKEYRYSHDDELRTESLGTIGLSGGVYLQIYKNFNIGIAMETYPSIVFKAGFTF